MISEWEPRCIRLEPGTYETVEQLLMCFGAGDASGLTRLFTDRVDWHGPTPRQPGGERGSYRNREIESFLLACYESLSPAGLTVRRLMVDGDQAVVIGRARCHDRATGEPRVLDFAASVTVSDGLVDTCWLLTRPAAPDPAADRLVLR